MVLQGSRGHPCRREGGGDGIYGLLKDTLLTPQPLRLKLESKVTAFHQNSSPNQHVGGGNNVIVH